MTAQEYLCSEGIFLEAGMPTRLTTPKRTLGILLLLQYFRATIMRTARNELRLPKTSIRSIVYIRVIVSGGHNEG